jgi:hypothetical protein
MLVYNYTFTGPVDFLYFINKDILGRFFGVIFGAGGYFKTIIRVTEDD